MPLASRGFFDASTGKAHTKHHLNLLGSNGVFFMRGRMPSTLTTAAQMALCHARLPRYDSDTTRLR